MAKLHHTLFVSAFLLVGAGCANVPTEPSTLVPTDEERACERDTDCVYADNSVCPFTSLENIVAVNKTHADAFRARHTESNEGILCIEIYVAPDENPKCVNRLCTLPDSTIG